MATLGRAFRSALSQDVPMASRRAGLPLTAPSLPLFAIAVILAILAVLAQYGGVAIPFISAHVFDTLAVAFAVLTAGVLLRGA